MLQDQYGLVEVYCGEGKGKTTAALGLALRAHGRGARVLWTSFLKDYDSGEFLEAGPFTLYRGQPVESFLWTMTQGERTGIAAEHTQRLEEVFALGAGYDVLVLDELLGALETGCIQVDQVFRLLQNKPPVLEVVITGRYLPPELEPLVDYVSRIDKCKHPFDRGIGPRRGIES